ncbi:MAG: leucine-rich repeat protein, partial [Candidatus Methanomethylophilaceae archaeon]|nr:leucine-rich repeat protein [Candidatus Methanomethylophilaceae archaeon]
MFLALSLLVLFVLLSVSDGSDAEEFEVDGICYDIVDGEATITGTSIELLSNFVFPDYISYSGLNVPVKAIEAGSFVDTTVLNGTIILPGTLEIIMPNSFSNCVGLTSIGIQSGYLSSSSFTNCNDLLNIDIGPNVKYVSGVFFNCYNVESIFFNSSFVTNYEKSLFSTLGSDNDISVTIGDSVTSLNPSIFYGLVNVSIHDGSLGTELVSIGPNVFKNCTFVSGTNTLTINKKVSNIDENAFSNCSNLLELIVVPENTYFSSKNGALYSVNGVNKTLIKVPDLKTGHFVISDVTNRIVDTSFDNCNYITTVSIPSSITTIPLNSFREMEHLEKILVSSDNSVYYDVDGVLCLKDSCKLICFPRNNQNTSYVVPNSIKELSNSSFFRSNLLVNLTIGDHIEHVESNLIVHCSKLRNIYYNSPSSASYLVENSGDDGGYSIYFGDGIRKITTNTIKNDSKLKKIYVNSNPTFFESNSFDNCSSLIEVYFTENLRLLPSNTFANCTNVKTITVPIEYSTKLISAFTESTSVERIVFLGGSSGTGSDINESNRLWAPHFTTSNVRIELSNGVKRLDYSMFAGCYNITELGEIPDSVSYIEDGCFRDTSLTSISVSLNNTTYSSKDGCLFSKLGDIVYWCPGSETTHYFDLELSKVAP